MTAEQVMELAKCQSDPEYFMENYVEIVTSDEGITQFKMRKYQKRMVRKMHKNNRVIMRAARQSGKTETCSAYILWYLLFNEDRTCAILANKEATATEIVSRVQGMYMRVPLWMQQGIDIWNTTSFLLENGSRLISSATSSDAIRGFRIDLLYLDEYAHVDNAVAMDFFTSVYPTISSGKRSKVIISSTPKGMNHFYKMFTDAQNHLKSRSQFKHITVTWDEVPGRNKLWMEDMKLQLGEERFMQEQEVEFMGSGGTLISGKFLRELAFVEPIQELLDHKLRIYEEPLDGHRYVAVADVSHGKELDYSALSVIDVTQMPYRVVATYHSNEMPAELYPSIIAQVGQLYNMAYILCESNDIGSLVIRILIDDLEYDNVFYTEPDKIYKDTKATESTLRSPGVKTSNKTKRQGCNTLKQLIENKQLIIEDFETISELASFVIKKNKTYAADDGKHDDCVMTLVLFAWLCTQQFFKDLASSDARSELYKDAYEQITSEIPLPPMISLPDPGPGKFVEQGVVWEEVTWENGDLKWLGYPT